MSSEMHAIELWPVGHVASSLVDRADAPRQGDEGSPEASLVFDAGMRDAVADLEVDTAARRPR